MRCLLTLLPLVTLAACSVSDTEDDYKCPTSPINQQLTRVFYVGYSAAGEIGPNKGTPFVDVREPTWVDSTHILVFTGFYIDQQWVRGFFKIQIDENTMAFQDYTPYAFDYCVLSIAFDPATNRLFALYGGSDLGVSQIRLGNETATIQETLVNADWNPRGIATWSGRDGIVFYGRDPISHICGFYWHTGSGAPDSLLYPICLGRGADQKFAIDSDGRYLYFGGTTDDWKTRLIRLDLIESQTPADTLYESSRGVTVSCRPHPKEKNLILFQYHFIGDGHNPPDGKVVLIDAESGLARGLNVRTHNSLCRFTINENVSWSPEGKHFAISSGSIDGEGGYRDLELWVYRDLR